MKIKNIFRFLIIAFLATQLESCDSNEAEQKFDKTPAERINAQKKSLTMSYFRLNMDGRQFILQIIHNLADLRICLNFLMTEK